MLSKSDKKSNWKLRSEEETVSEQVFAVDFTIAFLMIGWKYAMLKDVTVHKVMPFSSNKNLQSFSSLNKIRQLPGRDQNSATFFTNSINIKKSQTQRTRSDELDREKRQIPEAVFIVLSDGCRNPVYRAIATDHPTQDPEDNLVVRFNFKAFMFQDMQDSGNIRVTAKIIACVEEEDCRPVSPLTAD